MTAYSSVGSPDLLAICETWLDQGIDEYQISLPFYGPPYRCDRGNGKRGGGVCLYVKKNFGKVKILSLSPCPECECLWVFMPVPNIILVVIYIPPNLRKSVLMNIVDYLMDSVDLALEQSGSSESRLIVAGDTNQFPTDLLCENLGLKQVVSFPTRKKATLDKILLDSAVVDEYLPPIIAPSFGNSDHFSVLLQPAQSHYHSKNFHKVYDYRRSNLDKLYSDIRSYPWHIMYTSDASLQEKCSFFYSVLNFFVGQIPFSFVELTDKDKPWVTPKLKMLINKRFEAFRAREYNLYNHYKRKIKREILKAKQRWTQDLRASKDKFWKIVGTLSGTKSKSGGMLCNMIKEFDSPQLAAEYLNESFVSIFTEAPNWTVIESLISEENRPWNINIDVEKIDQLLRSVKVKKSCGSDNLSPKLLRECAGALSGPLSHLFSLSINNCSLPAEWKIGNVVPVPKPHAKSVNDLRPITLLPIVSKILEKLVVSSIKDELIQLYGKNQFGFRPGASSVHAHLELHDFVTHHLDNPVNKGVLLISFDMKKAFDKLSHLALFKSLTKGKIPKRCIQWLMNYFENRQQRVILKHNVSSSLLKVTSGVPQGSVLGPFLFAAHIGSFLAASQHSNAFKYADDIVIACPIQLLSSCDKIFTDEMTNMCSWCSSNGLFLNTSKTNVMVVGHVTSPVSGLSSYECEFMKILGVTFNKAFKWDDHIHEICRKASSRLRIIRILRNFLTIQELSKVYNACVRSVLEYNCEVFVGLNGKNSKRLERINKRAHRIICGKSCRCTLFPPLNVRREAKAMKTFLSLKKEDHVIHHLFPDILTRSRHLKLSFINTSLRAASFVPYCSRRFNESKSVILT